MLSTQTQSPRVTLKPGAKLPVFVVTRYRHEDFVAVLGGSANREGSS